VILHTR
jgi:hypothetical protein